MVSVLIAIGFSILMLKEFFIKDWLRHHFLLYATSHMLIMPLFAMVIFSATTHTYLWEAPYWYWFYSFVGFFVTFNWEVSRKIRAPKDEIQGVDSYTKIFGTYGAGYMVLLIRVIDTAMVALVGMTIGAGPWFFAALILLFCVCMGGFLHYRLNTNTATAKRMEIYAGMYIIAFDLILTFEIIRIYGFVSPL
jgi:4-hydroxybenzoate polyprenyltransferase